MSLRAQICSSPIDDITVTTRSFPSANPSLIYMQLKSKHKLQGKISDEQPMYVKHAPKSFKQHIQHFMTYLAKQIFIGRKPQIILGVSCFS